MAGVIEYQNILDGYKTTIIKYTIKNDGSGDLVQEVLFDASAYLTGSADNKIMAITYSLNRFTAELFWDATAPIPIMSLAKDQSYEGCFWKVGGLVNNGAAGRTGNILISTADLTKSDGDGFIILYLIQRNVAHFKEV